MEVYTNVLNSFMAKYGIYIAAFCVVVGIIAIILGKKQRNRDDKTKGILWILLGIVCIALLIFDLGFLGGLSAIRSAVG